MAARGVEKHLGDAGHLLVRELARPVHVPLILLHRGTSLIGNSAPLGPYSSPMPKALW